MHLSCYCCSKCRSNEPQVQPITHLGKEQPVTSPASPLEDFLNKSTPPNSTKGLENIDASIHANLESILEEGQKIKQEEEWNVTEKGKDVDGPIHASFNPVSAKDVEKERRKVSEEGKLKRTRARKMNGGQEEGEKIQKAVTKIEEKVYKEKQQLNIGTSLKINQNIQQKPLVVTKHHSKSLLDEIHKELNVKSGVIYNNNTINLINSARAKFKLEIDNKDISIHVSKSEIYSPKLKTTEGCRVIRTTPHPIEIENPEFEATIGTTVNQNENLFGKLNLRHNSTRIELSKQHREPQPTQTNSHSEYASKQKDVKSASTFTEIQPLVSKKLFNDRLQEDRGRNETQNVPVHSSVTKKSVLVSMTGLAKTNSENNPESIRTPVLKGIHLNDNKNFETINQGQIIMQPGSREDTSSFKFSTTEKDLSKTELMNIDKTIVKEKRSNVNLERPQDEDRIYYLEKSTKVYFLAGNSDSSISKFEPNEQIRVVKEEGLCIERNIIKNVNQAYHPVIKNGITDSEFIPRKDSETNQAESNLPQISKNKFEKLHQDEQALEIITTNLNKYASYSDSASAQQREDSQILKVAKKIYAPVIKEESGICQHISPPDEHQTIVKKDSPGVQHNSAQATTIKEDESSSIVQLENTNTGFSLADGKVANNTEKKIFAPVLKEEVVIEESDVFQNRSSTIFETKDNMNTELTLGGEEGKPNLVRPETIKLQNLEKEETSKTISYPPVIKEDISTVNQGSREIRDCQVNASRSQIKAAQETGYFQEDTHNFKSEKINGSRDFVNYEDHVCPIVKENIAGSKSVPGDYEETKSTETQKKIYAPVLKEEFSEYVLN